MVLAVVVGLPPTAGAQDPAAPPCPAGVMVTPTFGVADNPESESGSTRLYASHPITIAAGFTLEAQADSFAAVWTLPAGLTRASDDLAVSALPDSTPDQASMVGIAAAAGSYTVTITWTQTDGTRNGRCTGSASTSFDVLKAAVPKLRRPRVTPGLPDESTVALRLPKHGGDLRPLEVHLRWVRAQRFPGAGAKERVLTVPQLRTDPGFDKLTDIGIRAGALRVEVKPVALECAVRAELRLQRPDQRSARHLGAVRLRPGRAAGRADGHAAARRGQVQALRRLHHLQEEAVEPVLVDGVDHS